MTWIHDLVLSYLAGIALGAPIGLLALWLTARPETLTGIIVGMMCCVLLVRRDSRRRDVSVSTAARP